MAGMIDEQALSPLKLLSHARHPPQKTQLRKTSNHLIYVDLQICEITYQELR